MASSPTRSAFNLLRPRRLSNANTSNNTSPRPASPPPNDTTLTPNLASRRRNQAIGNLPALGLSNLVPNPSIDTPSTALFTPRTAALPPAAQLDTQSNAQSSSATTSATAADPHLRIVPHLESTRSLHFEPIERDIRPGMVLKIGRFTDKHQVPHRVTFKSKVVSRGHAEIWAEDGKFYIRDTKSSSGTFLNHVRLSAPNVESKPFMLKDGDVVQLGVDYQGGTEEIYRCVKMRIEVNRSWQKEINNFNSGTLKQLKALASPTAPGSAAAMAHTDCCICLFTIGPCQALFIAPCSHLFHYKCIRPMLRDHHPGFLCPLCRTFADLEANVEVDFEWPTETKDQVEELTNGVSNLTVEQKVEVGSTPAAAAAVTAADTTLLPPIEQPEEEQAEEEPLNSVPSSPIAPKKPLPATPKVGESMELSSAISIPGHATPATSSLLLAAAAATPPSSTLITTHRSEEVTTPVRELEASIEAALGSYFASGQPLTHEDLVAIAEGRPRPLAGPAREAAPSVWGARHDDSPGLDSIMTALAQHRVNVDGDKDGIKTPPSPGEGNSSVESSSVLQVPSETSRQESPLVERKGKKAAGQSEAETTELEEMQEDGIA